MTQEKQSQGNPVIDFQSILNQHRKGKQEEKEEALFSDEVEINDNDDEWGEGEWEGEQY